MTALTLDRVLPDSGALRSMAGETLTVDELRGLVDLLAANPDWWRAQLREGVPAQRWYDRLYHDPRVEVWLLGWGRSHATSFHDHGGSRGAYRVLGGSLTDVRVDDTGRLASRLLPAGRTAVVERGDIHDVRSEGPNVTYSIHAYSPPLTTMTYFTPRPGGLERIATLPVDGPEDER